MKNRLKKLFIPHEENGYRPDALQRTSMGIMFALVLATFALANLQAVLWMASDWMVGAVLPSVLVELTNEERTDDALGGLTVNAQLTEAANMKAEDMAMEGYFAHYAPDGTSPWHWFDEASYEFVHAGENLAVHFTESDEVVHAWMDSPAHRANILDSDFTEIGIGTARGEYKGYPTVFVVQLFGTPAAASQPESDIRTEDTTTDTTDVETRETPPASSSPEGDTDPASNVLAEAAGENIVTSTTPETASNEGARDKPDASTTDATNTPSPTYASTRAPSAEHTETVVYSELATTSRSAVLAESNPTDVGPTPNTTSYARLLVKGASIPSIWLQIFYGAVAAIVVFALIVSVLIEWRRQRPAQIAYGGGLLAAMALLLYIHVTLSSGATIM